MPGASSFRSTTDSSAKPLPGAAGPDLGEIDPSARSPGMRRGDPHRSLRTADPLGRLIRFGASPTNQRACHRRAWCTGAGAGIGAKRRGFRSQCLPGWNQRLLVCSAARRFPSRRTGAVSRPDRIGTSPKGDVSRSRSLPPPGGPFSRDDPDRTARGAFDPPASARARRCAHRALGRELTPPPTQPAPRQSAPGVDKCRGLELSRCLLRLARGEPQRAVRV